MGFPWEFLQTKPSGTPLENPFLPSIFIKNIPDWIYGLFYICLKIGTLTIKVNTSTTSRNFDMGHCGVGCGRIVHIHQWFSKNTLEELKLSKRRKKKLNFFITPPKLWWNGIICMFRNLLPTHNFSDFCFVEIRELFVLIGNSIYFSYTTVCLWTNYQQFVN